MILSLAAIGGISFVLALQTLDNFSLINYKNTEGEKMDLSAKKIFGYYYLQAIHPCA